MKRNGAVDFMFRYSVSFIYQKLEQEKPGTRRELAGIASLGVGTPGIGAGVFLLIL